VGGAIRAIRSTARVVAIALALLLMLCVGMQLGGQALDAASLSPPGQMVDVGGHRLRVVTAGLEHAGPSVILECGIGGSTAASWGWEIRGVSRFAPVVAYDRAGLGRSDPGPMPRDGSRLVAELHAALAGAGLHPPYVFAGHSYGGLLARLFTDRYPDEVAGVVLIESSHPGQFGRSRRPPGFLRVMRALMPAAPWAARLGLTRAFLILVHTDADLLPRPERTTQRAFLASPRHWEGVEREMRAWFPLTAPEAARAAGFGSRPLYVLTADRSARGWGPWIRMQDDLASLSSDAVHEVVPGTTHASIVTDSTAAAVVTEAIAEVVRSVRDARPLRAIAAERSAADSTRRAAPRPS
jgi:pimeloyl-ACP methyl ester carboxylesterase